MFVELIKELVTSKKFVVMVGAVVSVVLTKVSGKFGIVIDPALADEITKVICLMSTAYVVAQGISDHGKGAVEAALEVGAKQVANDVTVSGGKVVVAPANNDPVPPASKS